MAAAGNQNVDLDTVDFTTVECSRATYARFLRDIARVLHTIGNMHFRHLPPLAVDDLRNYFFVRLSNGAGHSIKLVLQRSSLYVVAYQTLANDRVWFFEDTTEAIMKMIFPDQDEAPSKVSPLNFQASYMNLCNRANVQGGRTNFALSMFRFSESISCLYEMEEVADDREIGRGFLTFIQTISESLRLKPLRASVARIFQPVNHVYETYNPTAFDVKCQNKWGNLSQYVHLEGTVVDTVGKAFAITELLNSP